MTAAAPLVEVGKVAWSRRSVSVSVLRSACDDIPGCAFGAEERNSCLKATLARRTIHCTTCITEAHIHCNTIHTNHVQHEASHRGELDGTVLVADQLS